MVFLLLNTAKKFGAEKFRHFSHNFEIHLAPIALNATKGGMNGERIKTPQIVITHAV